MILNSIEKIDKKQWEELAFVSKTASFFQTELCFRFYEQVSFLSPFVFAVSDRDRLKGVVVGYIQQEKNPVKQFFTCRAIVPGGAMLSEDILPAELEELLSALRKGLEKKAIYVEFRNFNDYSAFRSSFEKVDFEYVPHLNFHIDTSSEEVMMEHLGKSRKRDIRTSFRDGIEVVDSPSLEDVSGFYSILSELYRTKVKTPLFPFEFFEKLYSSGAGVYRLARYKGEIVGGTMCVCLDGRAVYEWFACGRDDVAKSVFPSTVATFEGMKYAARNGYPLFDMMGAGKPEEEYGVREFKAKFGGSLVEHGRFISVLSPVLFEIGKMGVGLLKKLK
jgi:FemAB family.